MAKRRKKPVTIGNPNDPEGLYVGMQRYLEALRIKNYSERTVENREMYLGSFIEWCAARSLSRPQEITKPILDRYQRHLFHYRRPSGKPLTFSSQAQALTPVRSFFKWLTRTNVLLWNPASEIELPKQEKRLPKYVLTAAEAERVLAQPNVNDAIGLRDRAILETLYSTGIRRMEVIHLCVYDLDAERGTLMVRQGKGKKDRMVPIGEQAVVWIRKYIDEARPQLVVPPDAGTLFLTQEGEEISREGLTQLVRRSTVRCRTARRYSNDARGPRRVRLRQPLRDCGGLFDRVLHHQLGDTRFLRERRLLRCADGVLGRTRRGRWHPRHRQRFVQSVLNERRPIVGVPAGIGVLVCDGACVRGHRRRLRSSVGRVDKRPFLHGRCRSRGSNRRRDASRGLPRR